MSKPSDLLEAKPVLGYIGSLVSLFGAWFSWFVEHADDMAKMFALFAGLFGMVAGYYTMRIQRRAWQKKTRGDGP